MSSYLDFFCENIENEDTQNADRILGACYSMCPAEEVILYVYTNFVSFKSSPQKNRKKFKVEEEDKHSLHLRIILRNINFVCWKFIFWNYVK